MRIWTNKAINPEVLIEAGVNDTLEITVDGATKVVTLTPGTYATSHNHFTSTLPAEINSQLIAESLDVTARIGGIHDDSPRTVLVFDHMSGGTLEITGGTAFGTIVGSIFSAGGTTK